MELLVDLENWEDSASWAACLLVRVHIGKMTTAWQAQVPEYSLQEFLCLIDELTDSVSKSQIKNKHRNGQDESK
jgi:hypothetical protein